MNMAALLLGLVLVGTALYLVASPLFRPVPEGAWEEETDERAALKRDKESVFTTLGEIEFDYQMKKLSPEDYQALKNMYKRRAVYVLKAEEESRTVGSGMDRASLEAEVEREIEAEIEAELAEETKK